MAGILVVLIIPAILAFIFSAWVVYSVLVDLPNRMQSLGEINSGGVIMRGVPSG